MDQGQSDRTPVSSIILFASVVLALTAYFTFRMLWGIDIPAWVLLAVLGLQFAAWLLGSRKVLTQLGAASLAAVIAVGACIAAVFLLFPSRLELQIAGAIGGGAALMFILASFVAASRADPVYSGVHEPLDLGDPEMDATAELIKYGEVRDDAAGGAQDDTSADSRAEEEIPDGQSIRDEGGGPPGAEERVYEFDELSESRLAIALGGADDDGPPGAHDPDGEELTKLLDRNRPPGDHDPDGEELTKLLDRKGPPAVDQTTQPVTESVPEEEPPIPDDWVEKTARSMAYEAPRDEDARTRDAKTGAEEGARIAPAIRMRARYKVLDAESGEHYGTYYSDEGYSTLDPASLTELIGPALKEGELRIVGLDWSNFDEVEVHVKVEEAEPLDPGADERIDRETSPAFPEPERTGWGGPEPDPDHAPAKSPGEENGREGVGPAAGSSGPPYMIYDRRTIQPMGEFVPEGDRPRIDRLTLYRMFPEYDFRTFEIDSVRWEEDEVRIFIRGEKKGRPKSALRSSDKAKGRQARDKEVRGQEE